MFYHKTSFIPILLLVFLISSAACFGQDTNSDTEALVKAIGLNDLKQVENLLNKPSNRRLVSDDDVVKIGLSEPTILELLIKRGLDIHSKKLDGRTLLQYAVYYYYPHSLKTLIRHGAALEEKTSGFSYLGVALRYDPPDIELFRMLIKSGADPNLADRDGHSALSWAFNQRSRDFVYILLDNGARVDRHPEDILNVSGDLALLKRMLSHGGNLKSTRDGYDLLMASVIGSHNEEMIQYLLKNGLSVSSREKYGKTALYYAAEWGRTDNARLLLEHGADPDAVSKDGETPWQAAARANRSETLQLLLTKSRKAKQKGALDSSLFAAFSSSAAIAVPVFGDLWNIGDTVKILLQHHANPSARNEYGYTPLQYGVQKIAYYSPLNIIYYVTAFDLLLKAGADVDAVDKEGTTALMIAAKEGNSWLVSYLHHRRADLDKKDKLGKTSLMYAAGYKIRQYSDKKPDDYKEVVLYLVNSGANRYLRDNSGKTALDIARKAGHIPQFEIALSK